MNNYLDGIVNSLPDSLIVLDADNVICFVNNSCENLLSISTKLMIGQRLSDFIKHDSPIFSMIEECRYRQVQMTEYDMPLSYHKIKGLKLDVHVSMLVGSEGHILVNFQERSIAQKINEQLSHRGAVKSVSGMASVLAHEIKNPLSGIKGSAQLLEDELSEEDKSLTRLICDEVDRICVLVDRMEVFSDVTPIDRQEVNIHQVLNHVRKLAENGFGKHVKFIERYDPSLPHTAGDKGSLIQVFLNLVKNAVEAIPRQGGEVILTTAYRHGIRVSFSGRKEKVHLPLEICIIDNGGGLSDEMKAHIFDPFVTTKSEGTGLGLALVAKIVSDHGGLIECNNSSDKTIFRILLPHYGNK